MSNLIDQNDQTETIETEKQTLTHAPTQPEPENHNIGTNEKAVTIEADLMPIIGTKPASLPDKFWDGKNNAVRLGALVNSYRELERKLSGMVPSPETQEGRLRLNRLTGVPETADGYDIKCDHGFFHADPDINRKFHEKNFTLEQVQTAYDIAAEKFVPLIIEMSEEYKADREVEKLVSAFGGKEKWQEVSRQLLAFGKKNLPPETLQSLTGSFEGVMMLHRMMKGEIEKDGIATNQNGLDGLAGHNPEDDLKEMMRDPRYWRDRDPSFVSKVTDGFKNIYSE